MTATNLPMPMPRAVMAGVVRVSTAAAPAAASTKSASAHSRIIRTRHFAFDTCEFMRLLVAEFYITDHGHVIHQDHADLGHLEILLDEPHVVPIPFKVAILELREHDRVGQQFPII